VSELNFTGELKRVNKVKMKDEADLMANNQKKTKVNQNYMCVFT